MKRRRIILLLPVVLLVVLTGCFLLIRNKKLYDDEYPHYQQIEVFLKRDLRIVKGLSKLPGYPLAVAALGGLFNLEKLPNLRAVSSGLSLLSIAVFFILVNFIDRQAGIIKTLQYILLPIQFPFLFLLYSEGFSNLAVFLMIYFVLKKKYFLGGILSILAVIIRQTNIIWAAMMLMIGYLLEYGPAINRDFLRKYLSKTFIFVAGFLLFILFVYLNKGVAVRDQAAMPTFQVHAGSVYWTLFLLFILFLPVHLAATGRIARRIARNRLILIPLIIFVITGVITFNNLHPMNTSWEHLRNRILLLFSSDLWKRTAFFIFISYTVLSLSTIKLIKKEYYLLYPFAFLSVFPFWLIESRYSLTAIILFMLFRKSGNRKLEYLILAIFAVFSLIFFKGYLNRDFYL
ncbi:hypothetical protein A3E42_03035 [Candidatus Gottesmanbacteria bacterium RIFCSPHIGHO2_12_FULL_40_13]|nr:MAG: hypothetical protein A3E42_03035 [Candidatus Gottesmanbacteria bacterium RIFCSPHIGHO2_12_FULL_40_13]